MSALTMSRDERQAFLAATRVGIVSIAEPERGPLTVPVWYRYAPGGPLCFATGARSHKATAIRKAGRVGFCVQTESPPYQYVSIEGPAVLGPVDYERDIRQMALRYLGDQMGEVYLSTLSTEFDPADNILVTITPQRWFSVDYSKMG
jgi:nitroimidazol reductase NimA-like FMN-containing flavoprotein (pyridoxamine 5'-phosphate oxidase superfamily)